MNAVQTAVSDGTLTQLAVGLEYYNQTDISLNRDDRPVALVAGTDYQWTSSTSIQLLTNVPVPAGVVLTLRRRTDNDQLLNIYDGGAPFTRTTLDENFEQLLRLSQEFTEGVGLDALGQDLSLGGYRVTNMHDPVLTQDAVSLGYLNRIIAALIAGGSGPSPSAANVQYLRPDGAISNLQQLSGADGTLLLGYGSQSLLGYLQVGVSRTVDSIAALQALVATRNQRAFVLGYYGRLTGGGGHYVADTSDTTAVHNGGTVIVGADGTRWKLLHNGITDLSQWGVVSDGSDQAARFQAAINWAQTASGVTEGVRGGLTHGPGKPITIGASLKFDIPIFMDIKSFILYTPTSGSALILGANTPTTPAGTRYYTKIILEGLRAVNGNTADPTGFPSAGSVGIEYRNQQFGDVCCKAFHAFTYTAVWYNSTNNVYTNQHMQDNFHEYGIFGYNGLGILAQSVSAELGATQVTHIRVKNFVTNYRHMILGNQNGNDNNTNDLKIDVLAMERCTAPDFVGVEIRGFANNIQVEYADVPKCKFVFAEPADANRLVIGNPGVNVSTVCGPTKNNIWRTGHPNPGILPASPNTAFATQYQNNYGVPVHVTVVVQLTPTTSALASATLFAGVTPAALSEVGTELVTAQTAPQTVQRMLSMIIQPGGVWQINKGTGGTVNIVSTSIRSFGM
jgi:hypothetical protein